MLAATSVRVYVVVDGDGVQDDQHWALRFEDVGVIQALSLSRWWVEVAPPGIDDPQSPTCAGSIYIGEVKRRDFETVAEIARSLRLNRFDGWNCQDFVMDLLAALEDGGIIAPEDDAYQDRKDAVRAILHHRCN